jgi:hypothetical protein
MSDQSITIVPKQSDYLNAKKKAKEILEWLVSKDVVKPTLSDCVLSSENGHAISIGANNVTKNSAALPYNLNVNGLEIVTERQVFDAGQNGIKELLCPNCKEDIASEDWDFLDEWAENKSNNLTCPLCKVSTDIHKFNFTPEWGFSNLGFRFWNWPPFTDHFINEFKQRLGCDIDTVYTLV